MPASKFPNPKCFELFDWILHQQTHSVKAAEADPGFLL